MNPWSPLAGLAMGAAGAAAMHLLQPVNGVFAAAVTAVLWTVLARDVRLLGGPAALGLALARGAALAWLAAPLAALVAAQTAPRAATVALAYLARPLDFRDTAGLRASHLVLASAAAAGTAALCGLRLGWFILSLCLVLLMVVRAWAESTAGGAGARHRLWLERTAECVILTTAACARCQW